MSNALTVLTTKLASRFEIGDANSAELLATLKATAFRGQVSDAQMSALLLVANQHGLNPWTREIYAFPDQNNGIVPVVGVDGWSRIINSHQMFDGMDFEQDETSCTCRIYRKDRTHPVAVTEYMSECKRGTKPWQTHPRRMLRHKAMIQCARIAFSYGGIFDEEEAQDVSGNVIDGATGEVIQAKPRKAEPLPPYADEAITQNLPKWKEYVVAGKKTPDNILTMLASKAILTFKQRERILNELEFADAATEAPQQESPMSDEHRAFVAEFEAADAA